MDFADNFEGKKNVAADGASAANARVARTAGLPATYSNGPNSEVIGQINVFNNQWGDTRMPQTGGYWDQQANYRPRQTQTTLPTVTL